ncbi:MAG: sigma-54 dependent transcriptional regulator [Rhodospirillaceae bacterium]
MTPGHINKVLIIEDEPALAQLYASYLAPDSFAVTVVNTGAEAQTQLTETVFNAVVTDVQLPDANGIELVKSLKTNHPETAVVVISAHGSVSMSVEAMRAGADDFLVKPFSSSRLTTTLSNVLKTQTLQSQISELKSRKERGRFHSFVGSSKPMQGVYRLIELAAKSKAPVLITGESGTGKELCAEALHHQGPRANKPFVALNCGAIPKDLLESEIFGHVKGAFTGATVDRNGAASSADGGILFLDEICELEYDVQSKLLRFLQTGKVQKVGSDHVSEVDVRVICATNRDPAEEVQRGTFRDDLYYRLNVIPIHLPSLRDRGHDVIEIAAKFAADLGQEERGHSAHLTEDAQARLLSHPWPGNVRELINKIRSAIVLNDTADLTSDTLGLNETGSKANIREVSASAKESLDAQLDVLPLWKVERQAIESAIQKCDGNIVQAAQLLEVSPSTIYRKRAEWVET